MYGKIYSNKDAGNISGAEYSVLSMVYVSAETDKLDDFLKLCMIRTENRDYSWWDTNVAGPLSHQDMSDYSAWKPDSLKLENIIRAANVLYAGDIAYLRRMSDTDETYQAYKDEVECILQRTVLLNEVSKLYNLRGEYNGTPKIAITQEEAKLQFSYRELNAEAAGYISTMYEKESTLTISAVMSGVSNEWDSIDRMKIAFSNQFAADPLNTIGSDLFSEGISQAVSTGAKKSQEQVWLPR